VTAVLDEPDAHLEDALEDLDFEDLFDDELDGTEDDPARHDAGHLHTWCRGLVHNTPLRRWSANYLQLVTFRIGNHRS
jgi:hypothetical protein